MTCPRKLQFFIKNVHLNFTICYMYLYGTVPLKYHFSKKCPLKLQNLLCIFICIVPLNYYFSKKCPLKFDNLLYIFTCINTFCQDINVQQTVL